MLEGIKKEVKSASKELNDAFRVLNENLGSKLLQADRENATVYLQRIPAFADLPAIAPAALVKPIPPNLDAAREGLFTSVIPDGRCVLHRGQDSWVLLGSAALFIVSALGTIASGWRQQGCEGGVCWICSAKALSKYTEMVDSLIREQMAALEGASDDARIKLREWELPECLQV